MNSIKLYDLLMENNLIGERGQAFFNLQEINVPIKDRSVFGNLIQEWLFFFMGKHNFPTRKPNNSQEFPDFFMNLHSNYKDLLEVKCFTKSPNFDIANFQAYARSLLESAYRLDAHYLIFEYEMSDCDVIIKNIWLKNVWQISCASERSPVKIQWKQGIPNNIRPATWYAEKPVYPVFSERKDFVLALEKVINISPQCENIRRNWLRNVMDKYYEQTGNIL